MLSLHCGAAALRAPARGQARALSLASRLHHRADAAPAPATRQAPQRRASLAVHASTLPSKARLAASAAPGCRCSAATASLGMTAHALPPPAVHQGAALRRPRAGQGAPLRCRPRQHQRAAAPSHVRRIPLLLTLARCALPQVADEETTTSGGIVLPRCGASRRADRAAAAHAPSRSAADVAPSRPPPRLSAPPSTSPPPASCSPSATATTPRRDPGRISAAQRLHKQR